MANVVSYYFNSRSYFMKILGWGLGFLGGGGGAGNQMWTFHMLGKCSAIKPFKTKQKSKLSTVLKMA